jgi:hypothetical protein
MSTFYTKENFNQLLTAAKLAADALADPYLGEDDGEREWPALDALSAAIVRAEGNTTNQHNQADALEVSNV